MKTAEWPQSKNVKVRKVNSTRLYIRKNYLNKYLKFQSALNVMRTAPPPQTSWGWSSLVLSVVFTRWEFQATGMNWLGSLENVGPPHKAWSWCLSSSSSDHLWVGAGGSGARFKSIEEQLQLICTFGGWRFCWPREQFGLEKVKLTLFWGNFSAPFMFQMFHQLLERHSFPLRLKLLHPSVYNHQVEDPEDHLPEHLHTLHFRRYDSMSWSTTPVVGTVCAAVA